MGDVCKKCKFFKSRQGKGKLGECRVNPPVIQLGSTMGEFPIIDESTWCGQFSLNLDKYQLDGKKIYTRKGRKVIRNRAQLEAYHDGNPDWHKQGDSTGDWHGR